MYFFREKMFVIIIIIIEFEFSEGFFSQNLKGSKKAQLNTAYQWGINFLIFAFIISGYYMGLIDCTVHINLIIIQTVLIKESILGSIFPCY